jgi:hypothetical protein
LRPWIVDEVELGDPRGSGERRLDRGQMAEIRMRDGRGRLANNLLWSTRRVMPKRSTWRVMQFDTLRLRLIKIAARVVELKTQLKIHLPSSAPDQAIFATLLGRLLRLVTLETGLMPRAHLFPVNLQHPLGRAIAGTSRVCGE